MVRDQDRDRRERAETNIDTETTKNWSRDLHPCCVVNDDKTV